MLGKTFVPRLNPKDSRRVVTLLDAGYELAISLNPVTTPGTVDRAILQDGDLCNPVLQYTPSRSQINGREGRKLEVRADTFVEDIFSILVFRNILFNTAYMKARFLPGTCRTFAFTSLEGFRNQLKYVSIYVEPSRVEEFFCNQNAFGQQHATPRHVQDCRLLWDVATSSDIYALHSFVGAPAPFAVVLQLLRHLHDSRGLLGMGLRGVYLTKKSGTASRCSAFSIRSQLQSRRTTPTLNCTRLVIRNRRCSRWNTRSPSCGTPGVSCRILCSGTAWESMRPRAWPA